MTNLLQEVQEMAMKKRVPVIRQGYSVRVHQKIKEGEKERIQIFEGLVIRINSGHGADKTFTVRKIVDGIGVEKIYPLYSTNILKIEVKKKSKIRRAKLYYMRERSGKSARLKETFVSEKEMEEAMDDADKSQVDDTNKPKTDAPMSSDDKPQTNTSPQTGDAPKLDRDEHPKKEESQTKEKNE